MELKRKPFQGVYNIIRFNWHFYLIALIIIFILPYFNNIFPEQIQPFTFWLSIFTFTFLTISLLVSFYIYDLSNLLKLNWIPNLENKIILNINAGFDETSAIIKSKFPKANLSICDFYNPEKHTEISIKRARKAYPPHTETIQVSTTKLPFKDNSFDCVLAILSAHEIRDRKERIQFFKELNRVIKPTGQIFVTEHLRDLNNFLAYTIGFFHFHSKSDWLKTFKQANLLLKKDLKITPFITSFILIKNGDTF